MKYVTQYWYSKRVPLHLRLLAVVFRALSALRRMGYRLGVLKSVALPVPVVVVGNINVGGTGKTPLVVWLVKLLKKAGYKPGIVTRGYGGLAQRWPQQVRHDSDPRMVGDEPVLLAQQCDCPIVADPDRVAAARALLNNADCDVIISDDGLQHYRLCRDIEIVVLDGERRFGNGYCLPAGPLRELPTRLLGVDFIVNNGGPAADGEFVMQARQLAAVNLNDPLQRVELASFNTSPVNAVAGIGHPQRFFDALAHHGLTVIGHPFDDHHFFSADDVSFDDDLPVLMTEKDAVKCRGLALDNHWWVPLVAQLDESFAFRFLERLKQVAEQSYKGGNTHG